MIATYRLQLTPTFGFAEAKEILPYLRRLGISHVYLSPVTEARPGSTHGYDVVDHNAVRAELGGALQLQLFLASCRTHKIHVILDIVPNHAGLGPQNKRWQDVLAFGPHSTYARYFDIAWEPRKIELHNKVLLPFLGGNYGEVLARGDIAVKCIEGQLFVTYFEHRFAVSPRSYAMVINHALTDWPTKSPTYSPLAELREAFVVLTDTDIARGETLLRDFSRTVSDEDFNVHCKPMETAKLHALLEQQFWRLANWHTAGHEVNYRRFFEINDLIGLRMEDPRVFTATHRLIKEMLCDEVITGLRIDHVDGLLDPQAYLERLRTLGARHIWVEKILAPSEQLSHQWPVDGTTGYEFGADVAALLTYTPAKRPLGRILFEYTRESLPFSEHAYRCKKLVMQTALAGELHRLAHALDRLSESDIDSRDFTQRGLHDALTELIATYPCYRSYLPYDAPDAARVVQRAIVRAQRRNVSVDPAIYHFIGQTLLTASGARLPHDAWVGRFQQYTAPVMAKGVEDSAFYRYHRLIALNEVGSQPDMFGMQIGTFHQRTLNRARYFPNTMVATSTHDSKRSEDLRMRLVALAEMPGLWSKTLRALHRLGARHRGDDGPSRQDRYLFFQTLVAMWDPKDTSLCERLAAYMEKASRESQLRTSWTNPNLAYEASLRQFVHGTLEDAQLNQVVRPLAQRLARHGLVNSISQLVLKVMGPGLPDFYRGCESLDLSLVDPDNRRPLDFQGFDASLQRLAPLIESPHPEAIAKLVATDPAEAKLYFTARLLHLRGHAAAWRTSAYRPQRVTGPRAKHAVAFARGACIVVVSRFAAILERRGGFGSTVLPLPAPLAGRDLTDMLSGAKLPAKESIALADLPLPWAVIVAA